MTSKDSLLTDQHSLLTSGHSPFQIEVLVLMEQFSAVREEILGMIDEHFIPHPSSLIPYKQLH